MLVPRESDAYNAFVATTLNHIKRATDVDATRKRQKVGELVTAARGATRPDERAALGRFALGADDGMYAQSGLAVLWSTAGAGDAELAPGALYAPTDATEGIRKGLMTAFRKRSEQVFKGAGANLAKLAPALRAVVEIEAVNYRLPDSNAFAEALDRAASTSLEDGDLEVLQEGIFVLLDTTMLTEEKDAVIDAMADGMKGACDAAARSREVEALTSAMRQLRDRHEQELEGLSLIHI